MWLITEPFEGMANEQTKDKTGKTSNTSKTDKAIEFFVLVLSIFVVILEIFKFFIDLLNPTTYFRNYIGHKEKVNHSITNETSNADGQLQEETKLVSHSNESSASQVLQQKEISDSKILKSIRPTYGNDVNDKDSNTAPINACVSATKSINSLHLGQSSPPTKTSNLSIPVDNVRDNGINLNTPAGRAINLTRKSSVSERSPKPLRCTPANSIKCTNLTTPAGRAINLTRKSSVTERSPKPLSFTPANGIKGTILNNQAGRSKNLTRKPSVTEKSPKPLSSTPAEGIKGTTLNRTATFLLTQAKKLTNLTRQSSQTEGSFKADGSNGTNLKRTPISLVTKAGKTTNLISKSFVIKRSSKSLPSPPANGVKGTNLSRTPTIFLNVPGKSTNLTGHSPLTQRSPKSLVPISAGSVNSTNAMKKPIPVTARATPSLRTKSVDGANSTNLNRKPIITEDKAKKPVAIVSATNLNRNLSTTHVQTVKTPKSATLRRTPLATVNINQKNLKHSTFSPSSSTKTLSPKQKENTTPCLSRKGTYLNFNSSASNTNNSTPTTQFTARDSLENCSLPRKGLRSTANDINCKAQDIQVKSEKIVSISQPTKVKVQMNQIEWLHHLLTMQHQKTSKEKLNNVHAVKRNINF
ncbi:hypothetical protein DOY81_010465 [Sarcophaga bullata]|nr:hypothetical protein DOY81_010465 [Sarcophaga bullata]